MSKRNSRRRHRKHTEHHNPPGSAPGSITVSPDASCPQMQVLAYGPDQFVESSLEKVDAVRDYLQRFPVVWINVDGLGDAAVIERIGEVFNLHRLALEDVVHTHQRAKVDDYEEVLFIVLRMADIHFSADTEQLSMFVGRNFVITFQEATGDCWEPVRARLRKKGGQLRGLGADYLAYALLDSVIDAYFPVLERYGERLEEIEFEILNNPGQGALDSLHEMKGALIALRRAVWPLRDAMAALTRDESPLIQQQTRVYLRDCYDHVIQVIDLVDIYRELAADLRDLYMSTVSNRINEVMRVLTIISTIFIPITFIASIYGMNFDFMPELHWKWGYPMALGMMFTTAVVMLVFFFRRGWFKNVDKSSVRRNRKD